MVIQDIVNAIGLENYYNNRYISYIGAGALAVIILLVGAYGYYRYTISRDQAAQMIYEQCMQDFNQAYQNPSLWPDVELAAKVGYQQHSNASLASYFLALQAEALIQQAKLDEALLLLQTMLKQLPTKSPYYYNYLLKTVLIKIDSADEATHQQGVQELEELAHNLKNTQRDQALYELGMYYRNNSNYERAQAVFKELTTSFPITGPEASAWAEQAKALEQYA